MRRQRTLIAAVVVVVVALGVVAAITVLPADASLVVKPVPPTVLPASPVAIPSSATIPATLDQPGSPAIVPTKPNTDPLTLTFTEADVRAYVAMHPHPDQVPNAPAATIVSIEFLPARVVDARIGDSGMSPDVLLCLVTLHGSFHVAGPLGSKGVSGSTGTLLFNAHTGNHLMETVGP